MSETDTNAEPDPEKTDRQDVKAAFRLRAAPPRVVRLSRKVLAGLAIVACLGIGAALIFALQGRQSGDGPNELFTTDNRPTADELRSLPSDYGSVPQLGPALPGDLGRPILRAQEEGRPVPVTTVPGPNPGPDPEEQRRLAELEAARTSELFVSAQGSQVQPSSSPAASIWQAVYPQPRQASGAPRRRRNGNRPSSTRQPIAAPYRPIASRLRPHPMRSRLARSFPPRSSPVSGPICRARSSRRLPRTFMTAHRAATCWCPRARV